MMGTLLICISKMATPGRLQFSSVITKLPNSEQSYKGKVKTHNYINRQNQSTTGTKLCLDKVIYRLGEFDIMRPSGWLLSLGRV